MAYTSNKKPGGLDAAVSLAGTNNIVVDQAGTVVRATLNQVEAKVFDGKTQVTPNNGDVVVIRRGSDIRQVVVENMLPAGSVTNAMLGGSIADSKLNTIDTAGKVTNQAVGATAGFSGSVYSNAIGANKIVTRDGSGNFAAGTITATLSGNATTATTATTVVDGAITNNKVANAAAILGTKISPNFGSQNVVTTGNVGIGTTNPAVKLEVTGSSVLGRFNGSGNTFHGFGVRLLDASGSNDRASFIDTVNENNESVASIQMPYFANGRSDIHFNVTPAGNRTTRRDFEAMRITNLGRVGIGTSAPIATLDVNGSVNTSGNISATNNIVASGNVGIGTTNPAVKLEVTGSGSIARFNGSGSTFHGIGVRLTDASASNDRASFIDTLNENSHSVANIQMPYFTDGRSDIHFNVTPPGSRSSRRDFEAMRITNQGRVGIGTNAPVSTLHVNGTVTATQFNGPVSDGSIDIAKLAAAVANALVPVGAVEAFARLTIPAGWLFADGQTIGSSASGAFHASANYLALYTVLWDDWDNALLPILNSSGVATTRGSSAVADFNGNKRLPLPDLRGHFIRAGGQNANGYFSDVFGVKQIDTMRNLTGYFGFHAFANVSSGVFRNISGGRRQGTAEFGTVGQPYDHTFDASRQVPVSHEFRPANIALTYCIKF
jgi:hypothetical protein